jgi:hypothetical protein
MRRLVLPLLLLSACGAHSGLQGQQLERIEAYRAERAHDFALRFAKTHVSPGQADLVAQVTAAAINAPLQRLNQKTFPLGSWEFTPTTPPMVELNTGSAMLRITGSAHQKDGRTVEVTLVGGLSVRWNEDGSHLYLQPTALAVVPTLHVSMLDFALGDFIRDFAQDKADAYLRERIGEIDVPITLHLPVQRQALALDHQLKTDPDPGVTLHVAMREASAEVRLRQLYVWPLEGKLVVLAFVDVADASLPEPVVHPIVAPSAPAVDGGAP